MRLRGPLLTLLVCGAALASSDPWEPLREVPIQSEGRFMPLDTYARVLALKVSGRQAITLSDGSKLDGMQWLMRLLFTPEKAAQDPVFLINSPEVLDALKLDHDKARDRYTFAFLEPGIPTLMRLENKARGKAASQRTRVEHQLIELAAGMREFELLSRTFSFLESEPRVALPAAVEALGESPSLAEYTAWIHALDPETDTELATSAVHELRGLIEGTYSSLFAIGARHPREVLTGSDVEEWASPWDLFIAQLPEDRELLGRLGELRTAYRAGGELPDLGPLRETLLTLATGDVAPQLLELEVHYNQLDAFFYTLLLYVAAFLVCAISLMGKSTRWLLWVAFGLAAVGFGLHSYGIVLRMIIRGRPPVSTLYETMLFVAWIGMLVSLLIELIWRKSFGLFSGALLGAILMWIASRYAVDGDTMGVLIAVLDSNFWLSTHVTTVTIGYSASLLAAALGHVAIFANLFARSSSKDLRRNLNRTIYGVVAFATIFSFLGTILGGIWADQSWGRFWGWDPKENGALLIVLWNTILLHARLGGYLKRDGMALGAVLGSIWVALAWWGVNLLSIGLHSYGFDNGVATNLALFCGSQVLVFIVGLAAVLTDRKPKKKEPSLRVEG